MNDISQIVAPERSDRFFILFSILVGITASLLAFELSLVKLVLLVVVLAGAVILFRYPIFCLILAFSSGIFKEWLTGNVALFNAVDFTTFIFLMTFCVLFSQRLLTGDLFYLPRVNGFLPLVFFSLAMMLALFYTPSPKYGLLKAGSFLAFNWTLFLFAFWGIRNRRELKQFGIFMLALSAVVSLYTIMTLTRAYLRGDFIYSYRASFLGVNPISFANWIGAVNIFLITLLPILRKRAHRLTAMALVALYSATMLVTNSRGPMVSFVLSLIVLFLYHFRTFNFVKIITRMFLIILFALLLFLLLPEQMTSRYVDLFGGGSDVVSQTHSAYTINTRLFAWKAALSAAFSSPVHLLFGIGVGGFSSLFYGMDVRLYPHNMVIEVFCELGLVGLSLLLWHFYAVFRVIVKKLNGLDQQKKVILLSLMMGTVYLLLAALFSGDLNDNRRVWFFMGTALAAAGILSINEHQKA